jgi:hypothetical protein
MYMTCCRGGSAALITPNAAAYASRSSTSRSLRVLFQRVCVCARACVCVC